MRGFSAPRRATLGDGWALVVFSVPETQRAKRHELRTRLAHLGFGTVAPGVWLAPGTLACVAKETLARRELAGYVDIFKGRSSWLRGPGRQSPAVVGSRRAVRQVHPVHRALPAAGAADRRARGPRRAAGVPRLCLDADRVAAAALPRPGAAARAAARGLERGDRRAPLRRTERAPARAGLAARGVRHPCLTSGRQAGPAARVRPPSVPKGLMTGRFLADCAKCDQPVIPGAGLRVKLFTNRLCLLASPSWERGRLPG